MRLSRFRGESRGWLRAQLRTIRSPSTWESHDLSDLPQQHAWVCPCGFDPLQTNMPRLNTTTSITGHWLWVTTLFKCLQNSNSCVFVKESLSFGESWGMWWQSRTLQFSEIFSQMCLAMWPFCTCLECFMAYSGSVWQSTCWDFGV